jgi:hypothetical protein
MSPRVINVDGDVFIHENGDIIADIRSIPEERFILHGHSVNYCDVRGLGLVISTTIVVMDDGAVFSGDFIMSQFVVNDKREMCTHLKLIVVGEDDGLDLTSMYNRFTHIDLYGEGKIHIWTDYDVACNLKVSSDITVSIVKSD